MYQIVQYQKNGQMSVEELPAPECLENGILVKNHYSLISAGTEKTSVTNAQSLLIARAKKQPEQVKLVLDLIKKDGLFSAINKVRSKLDSYKSLGYSTAGVVIESRCPEFTVGDRVSCAGANLAVHSEVISVPKNLAVKLPENVSFADASYCTLGAIAMQGIRQANPALDETVAVIGLGLLGQMTVQMLKANGCRVIGLDINKDLFATAKKFGCDECFYSSGESIKSILAFTSGLGCDSVIITASSSSNQPLELAMKIARKRGTVVLVGAVDIHISRSPFYEKEIDFKISCSYGPGRYDSNYEMLGNDYPAAFVRWTENRNMQAVLSLISSGKLNVKDLTTHTFDIQNAPEAYNLITGKTNEKHLGVLINYPERVNSESKTIKISEYKNSSSKVKIGFIGAGIFGQNYLLPALQKTNAEFVSVSTTSPVNALSAAKKFGFPYSSTDSKEIINSKDTNTIFIATRHDSHSELVIESLKAGKNVFVEKPLAVNEEQLVEIIDTLGKTHSNLMVGYNRRFSESFRKINDFFKARTDAMNILYRVNAGSLPRTHWLYEPGQGEGRIIGEACHFIDCMVYLTKAKPIEVFAHSISTNNTEAYSYDNSIISIKFSDGSIGSLCYFANGDTSYPKEYCEVFCENSIAVMNNFEEVKLTRAGKTKSFKFDGKKGHQEEVSETIKALETGSSLPISIQEIIDISKAAFAAMESIKSGKSIKLKN